MATQVATRPQGGAVQRMDDDNPFAGLERSLSTRGSKFAEALPSHIKVDKFQRTVMTAAQSNPDLLKADRASLITACMKAAQDGLLPDGREAALVIYSNRVQQDGQWVSVKTVQYLPMVFGVRKKLLQSGEISSIETNVVYRREAEEGAFIYEAGTEAMLRHRPMLDLTDEESKDDQIVAAYSVAVMKDGTKSFEVMRRSEINKVRQASQTGATGQVGKFGAKKGQPIDPKGPWVDWFGEMARKTVMRRHAKTLPQSGDLLVDIEGRDQDIAERSATRLLEVEADAPAALPPTREDVAAGGELYDPATGEIDEATARALDLEGFAAMEGRTDEQHGDQHDGADDAPHPAKAIADDLIERCTNAAILGDVLGVEGDYRKHAEAMPLPLATGVEAAIKNAKARFGKAAK